MQFETNSREARGSSYQGAYHWKNTCRKIDIRTWRIVNKPFSNNQIKYCYREEENKELFESYKKMIDDFKKEEIDDDNRLKDYNKDIDKLAIKKDELK